MSYNKNIFTKGTVTYSDIDLSFKTNPITGDIRRKTDVDAIKQSLMNLFFTNFGERPFRPWLCGDLNKLLFEPNDSITTEILKEKLQRICDNFEVRIDVIEITVSDQALDDNSKNVGVKFNMVNSIVPQEINIIIRRTR